MAERATAQQRRRDEGKGMAWRTVLTVCFAHAAPFWRERSSKGRSRFCRHWPIGRQPFFSLPKQGFLCSLKILIFPQQGFIQDIDGCWQMKGCLPKALPIRIFLPRKTLQPSTGSINYLYESELGVYGCDTPTRHNPAQKDIAQIAKNIQLPAFPLGISRQMFFAKSLIFFPNPALFFTICAEKVCYKLANMYYKVCNTYYKLCNKRYKLYNKNYLIWQEKLSCG